MLCESGGDWFPGAWRKSLDRRLRVGATLDCFQLPHYDEDSNVGEVEQTLTSAPPLVSGHDIRCLQGVLSRVARGDGSVIQGGDCAESLDRRGILLAAAVCDLMYRMSVVVSSQIKGPIVSIGRIAGQYAKPRSKSTECLYGVSLPVYRGDLINGLKFTKDSRRPDPRRMLRAYRHAAHILDTLSSLSHKALVDMRAICADLNVFSDRLDQAGLYEGAVESVRAHLERFEQRRGFLTPYVDPMLYTSHEALLLPYEQALTRFDEETECWYCGSAHFLWVGDRTRDPSGPHVEFLRGISNPVGVKLGPSADADTVLRLCHILNPQNIPGRLTLIVRMGAVALEKRLPQLIQAVRREGFNAIWSCDPMHANTKTLSSGQKTRCFDDIAGEICSFFSVHGSEGSYPGALHLELTGFYATECAGGVSNLRPCTLGQAYHTLCDPRLNMEQALELAFLVVDQLRYAGRLNNRQDGTKQHDCATR